MKATHIQIKKRQASPDAGSSRNKRSDGLWSGKGRGRRWVQRWLRKRIKIKGFDSLGNKLKGAQKDRKKRGKTRLTFIDHREKKVLMQNPA